jgi:hypothetical protein
LRALRVLYPCDDGGGGGADGGDVAPPPLASSFAFVREVAL